MLFTSSLISFFSLSSLVGDLDVAKLFIKTNDTHVQGNVDFSCMEAIMMMYPSILWITMMRQNNDYIKNEILTNYLIKSQKGTVLRLDRFGPVVADSIPSWKELTGSDESLQQGISFYTQHDCTPSVKQLLPDLLPEVCYTDIEFTTPTSSTSTLEQDINDLADEMWYVHSSTTISDPSYSFQKRVMVDHILHFIKVDLASYAQLKSKKLDIHTFPLVWRMVVYFHTIFTLMSRCSYEKYEKIINHDNIISTILLDDQEIQQVNVKNYQVYDLTLLNESIHDNIPTPLRQKMTDYCKNNMPGTHIYQLPSQMLQELNQYYIDTSTQFPNDQFIQFVQSMLRRRCSKDYMSLQKWQTEARDNR
jgi:hypothetical protein